MSILNIHLPDELKSFLDEQVSRRGYKDASAFLQALVEEDRRRSLRDEIESSLEESLQQPSSPLTDADFDDIERQGLERLQARRQK